MKMKPVIVWNPLQGPAIQIEMHDARGVRQTKFAMRTRLTYTLAHDPPRREPRPVAKTPANWWDLTAELCQRGQG
jgi:hypothetical protein